VSGGDAIALSTGGSAADAYAGPFHWSPDSNKLIAFRVKEVESRKVYIVRTSPKDQVQPELVTFEYPKPGDPLPQPKPRLFDIPSLREIPVDDGLFANPWEISEGAWNGNSSEFSFVYNQRGHQILRLIALRADSGSARVLIEETSPTFIDYAIKSYLRRLPDGLGVLWASERSGYNHLYRFDSQAGALLNPVTQGEWNVREVVEVDVEKRRLLLRVMGMPGSNPYFQHFVRVNMDGAGLTRLTEGDGCHRIAFSPCRRWIVDAWSRVDQPPVTELRDAESGRLIAELARGDDSALLATGWSRPERFVAKGRDGSTDIHGVIVRPTHFDPAKSYPVVESIYAGPHGYFVPTRYSAWSGMNSMAELGFVVVKIDGMGTNWRSKAFHDVSWKNLKDAGFPDRIPWIRAAAATRPWMDLTRVGIFGGSAGGQNALAALLHHGDFYQVAVADCGCHDNRMDKVWWNEAWMGWPVDESYVDNSNVTHAAKLRGKLLLIVGELDNNVDPASTYQVVGALQRAGKDFEFMPIINAGHGAAETPYGSYRRAEFLVRHLGATVR
jgi:dipeptidyl aminopeptidase/acylaminoacyl peptidase